VENESEAVLSMLFNACHTKDVIKLVPVVPLFSNEHSKGKILALSQELR